jgi:ATP-dependent DNA helicase RecG
MEAIMSMPIDIETLLNKQRIESERIEFKRGWNPASVYRTNILFETVQKVAGRAEAKRFWNYPYEALEEAIVNSLYHRDYSLHEPVEISIEPDGIDILNCPGPDYSIPMAAIEKGDYLKSRRYRNRRLGDFLKELELTEGRSTGVPTIQEKLAQNGSPRATFETTEDRLSILIHIPVHEGCGDVVVMKSAEGSLKNSDNTEKWPKKWPKKWPEIASKIMEMISSNSKISVIEMESLLNVGHTTIKKIINEMQNEKMIQRIGPNKGGHWETIK